MLDGFVPWPQHCAEEYRRCGFWRGEPLGELLARSASAHGERPAVVASGVRWSYAELARRAASLALGLHRLGITRADRVVVQLPNVPELIALVFALFRIGAIPVFAQPAHRRHEIGHLCELSQAVAYVVPDTWQRFDYRNLAAEMVTRTPTLRHVIVLGASREFTSLVDLAAEGALDVPQPRGGDVALFQLSGGTTGLPKLIPRTHDDYGYSVRASAEVCGLGPTSSYLAVLPVGHNFPLSSPGVLGTIFAGGKVVLSDSGSPDVAFRWIEREQVDIAAVVPPLALMWVEAASARRPNLSSLRLLQVGGAKLAVELARRIPATLGCELQQVFGMAEGLLNYTRLGDSADIVSETQGRPLSPADEVRIVDDDDRPVPAGEVGHLLTRGPYTIRGYYRAAEYNCRAFTADGFYRTGDRVKQLPSGHLVVMGRAKDVINRGGDKVPAQELEEQLLAHPAVRDVAVVAAPDPFLGERTCAVVIATADPPRLLDLKQFLRRRGLAEFKLPDRLEVVASFPVTSVGKVDKNALRALVAGCQSATAPSEP